MAPPRIIPVMFVKSFSPLIGQARLVIDVESVLLDH